MKTVLAHGCFDLLHLGHIRHLQEARKLGDRLVVSVTADKYVNKGAGRPRFTDEERAEALNALKFVDKVIINHAADAVGIIQQEKPAAYVKGADYCGSTDEALAREAAAVVEIGGYVVFTSTRKWSSTELLAGRELYADYRDALGQVQCDVDKSVVYRWFMHAKPNNARLLFVGNGGSAAIASHMAADFQKAGRIPSLCFNDAAQVTALANDYGYASVFVDPLRMHAKRGDLLVAISSSGESESIIDAALLAKEKDLDVLTLSGFNPTNRLRSIGNANFYVPSYSYGVVECTHQTILHSLLDYVVSE